MEMQDRIVYIAGHSDLTLAPLTLYYPKGFSSSSMNTIHFLTRKMEMRKSPDKYSGNKFLQKHHHETRQKLEAGSIGYNGFSLLDILFHRIDPTLSCKLP